jgi:glycosyltransferase involved in cell wall biosynthesis
VKVLHVIPAVAPRYGGPSRAVFEMCRAVRSTGAEVMVATTDADGSAHLPVKTGTTLDFQGTETIFFPRQFSERFGYSRPLAIWLESNVASFDVVHIHAVFSHPCLAAARACRRRNVPYIVRPLGSLDPWSLSQKRRRKRLIWLAGVKRMLKGAAAIHFTTAEEQRLAQPVGELPRGVVIPLGIDVESLEQTVNRSMFGQNYPSLAADPYVIVLSRLHPKKNLESLIQAFFSVRAMDRFQNWSLVIAGDGEAGYLASLKRQAGGEARIVFTGWLNGEEKDSALRGAALLALPSFQENFGLCVTEGLAYGVPVIVSANVNLAPDIEAAGAGWVTGLKPDEIERTLRIAMADADERRRRGQSGREFVVCNFGWPRIANELLMLYQQVAVDGPEVATLAPSFS